MAVKGVRITLMPDWGKSTTNAFDRMILVEEKVLGDLRPGWNNVVPIIQQDMKRVFKQGQGHWIALSIKYLKSKIKRTSRHPTTIGKLTNRMFKALTVSGFTGNVDMRFKQSLRYGLDKSRFKNNYPVHFNRRRKFMRLSKNAKTLISREIINHLRPEGSLFNPTRSKHLPISGYKAFRR